MIMVAITVGCHKEIEIYHAYQTFGEFWKLTALGEAKIIHRHI